LTSDLLSLFKKYKQLDILSIFALNVTFCQERMDKKILRVLLREQGTMQSQIQRELQLEQIP